MNFYELLYAGKNSGALSATYYELLFAKYLNPAGDEWAEYDGALPAQYSANGSALADYRIYGAAGGVGDDSGTAYGYVVPMSVSDGTTSTTISIYIGDETLSEDEYISYSEQKVYRRTEQLFNAETAVYKNGVYKNDSGIEAIYPGAGYYATYIPIQPSETIHVINVRGNNNLTTRLYFYDAQKQWIQRTDGYVNDFSIVTPNNAAYAQLQISPQFISSPNTITITQGSTAPSTYIPYLQPTDPPVPLPALPTVDGVTITDYAGQSAAVPSRFYAKYRKG